MIFRLLFVLTFWAIPFFSSASAGEIRMAVTTSFDNSGLSDILLPQIKEDLALDVRLVIVGTGQALKLGRAGDVDAILVHSKAAEEEFVSQGYGSHRREIMFNDFVLVGPKDDPANIASAKTVGEALSRIATTKSLFASRGDDSGTHRRELKLWQSVGSEALDPSWYRSLGSGMGATLNTASGMNAYALSDRGSWLKFQNKKDLVLLFAGDPALRNQYSYIPINPNKHEHVKSDWAAKLEKWLTGRKGQSLIGEYAIAGEQLFAPNAEPRAN